ncbi:hypothetical protein LEMA_P033980.1 [Plenodomus lingam JN3]|uniref:Uncharacterized protein n=1 Tax=Leptosphaeria maculans (strain JN3 / isolate v23.1.3 / race Av1-4-5-6-7-8) TaxID=985895 RepID=E4ZR59_LEPMJ|nr:hypothetical protein LEMA_P033980.1 [Plenodomus lingam JN3]CBX93724.1 hypothetical protein LEMA_P033980.1 [Plenodomus lingam JN3]
MAREMEAHRQDEENEIQGFSKAVIDVEVVSESNETYHPMDDCMRPSQAAKRRLAQGEQLPSSDDSIDCFPVSIDKDTQRSSDDSVEEDGAQKGVTQHQHAKKGKRRLRERSRSSSLPIRRSSRRVPGEKKVYDMSVHPQDEALELLSFDEEEVAASSSKRRRTNPKESISDASEPMEQDTRRNRSKQIMNSSDLGGTAFGEEEDLTTGGDSINVITHMSPTHDLQTDYTCERLTSPTPSVSTPPLHSIRRKRSLDVWKPFPGARSFHHDRDSWPFIRGQSFDIWTEQAEDEVAKEALVTLPLEFEHDDKENQLENTDQQTSDPLDGIAVIPASQYRQSDEDIVDAQNNRLVSEALYDESGIDFDAYGLDSTDGANDEVASCQRELGANEDIMRLLASGAHLPRAPRARSHKKLPSEEATTIGTAMADVSLRHKGWLAM